MNRSKVTSSSIRSIGYEGATLEVEFNSGAVYQYFSVPSSIYQSLLSASSPGSFIATNIRPNYNYKRL